MASVPQRGLVALLKRGWNEIPEVMGSSVALLVGGGITIYALNMYYKKDGDNRKHKMVYTVWRHDDPRVATLKKD